ncbi:MASE1 domain-containing protein [Bradyrhizobium diazoefficiens]|nr:MASE1 domain-containing protein [Bradyrhizobium diazoefficiens]
MALLSDRVVSPARQPVAWRTGIIFAVSTVAVAVVYFLAARLSLALLAQPDGVAVFWPAAGVASGILIGVGSVARWPVIIGVTTATIIANLLGDRNLASAVISAIANCGEALVIAGLIQRICGAPLQLDQLQRVVAFFMATVVGSVLSGIVGTIGFAIFHSSTAPVPTVWLHWFASDGLGNISVAPLAIGLASLTRAPPTRGELAGGALVLAVITALCSGMVLLPNQPWTSELAIAAFSPLLVFIAARFRPAFTAAAIFLCAITIVWTTTFGVGIFGDSRMLIDERILSAQAAILAVSFGGLVLAALFSERRLHEVALVERERRLEEALRAGGVMTLDWSVAEDRIRYSQNAEQILGVGSGQVLGSAEWFEQIHPDDRERVMACVNDTLPHKASHAVTFRYLRPDGAGEVWLEQIAVTQFDQVAKAIRIHGLTTDVTPRKRFEHEVSQARKAAELASRAKSSFLAAASHDLRQPLQTLKFLQTSLEQLHPEGDGRKLVADMERSLDTMSSMLSSLLELNQLESGNLTPATSEFALGEVFESVAADFRRPVGEKGLRWRLVRSAIMVRSDRRMLEEMLRNLLSNAVRYTDGGRVLLGCRRRGDHVRIEVWDSGVGVTQDQLPYIFDEYYQGDEGVRRGGFGLGLAIVKRLGNLLGHRIDVQSAPGRGTCFSVEVPRAKCPAQAPGRMEASLDNDGLLAREVLVIEDETSVRTALTRIMKQKGVKATVVATGDEALAWVRQQDFRPDLILSDYNLRGTIDGVQTIRALRAHLGWDAPAIVMTGDIRSDTVSAIAADDISVLIKPFSVNDLLQKISAASSPRIDGGSSTEGEAGRARARAAPDWI